MEDERPDPDALLKAIKEIEARTKKGRLKIFLGMSAGVGKTYAMLKAARKLVQEGVNLAVGSVYTHGREETAELLDGLTIIPEKEIIYKGIKFNELDLDEVLKRKPQLVLVDELAHSNVPGAKHPKRWQDVMELIDAGIDVYTTLNIQHIESHKDTVESIAGVTIRETVPDLILEAATDIELVDITPQELLQRLKEGKVYTGDFPEIAAQNFFQEDRLTALREMALRLAAEKVDQELHEMISAIQRGRGWKPRERLLVAVNHEPFSQQLIRKTRRLAFTLHAPWIAVYVDNGESLDEEETGWLSRNLALARELGAEVITIQDADIVRGIQKIAEQKGVTQILISKKPRNRLVEFFKPSILLDRLIEENKEVDIHIIKQSSFYPYEKKRIRKTAGIQKLYSYAHLLFWILVLSIFSGLVVPYVGYKVVGFIFLLGILLIGLFLRRSPVLLAGLLCALIWDFFFIPPAWTLELSSTEDSVMVGLFFAIALIIGAWTHRVRKRQDLLTRREQSTEAIYDIVREIAAAPSSGYLFKAIKEKLGSVLKGTCEIIVKKFDDGLIFENELQLFDEKEKAVANWVFENGKEAGWSTSTLPSVKNLYIPLKGFKETVGVLAYRSLTEKPLLPEETNFLYTVAQQLANYLERSFAEKQEQRSKQRLQIEKIYQKVLQSISHELKGPVSTIQKALFACKDEQALAENPLLLSSCHAIEASSEGLMRITKNASAMAKLSAGLMTFQKSAQHIEELIKVCCDEIQKSLKSHQLLIDLPENLPLIPFDFSLIEILLNNLLANAIDYSPAGTTIEIKAEVFDSTFVLSVSDEGPGIPEDMMDLVFEKFYRVPGTRSTGLGLGLAIAKSIAELHHGQIKAQNRPLGGARFSLLLPI